MKTVSRLVQRALCACASAAMLGGCGASPSEFSPTRAGVPGTAKNLPRNRLRSRSGASAAPCAASLSGSRSRRRAVRGP